LELLKLEDFPATNVWSSQEDLQEEEEISKPLGVELRPLYYQKEIWTNLQEIVKTVSRCIDQV
jgi:hypothetical protein